MAKKLTNSSNVLDALDSFSLRVTRRQLNTHSKNNLTGRFAVTLW